MLNHHENGRRFAVTMLNPTERQIMLLHSAFTVLCHSEPLRQPARLSLRLVSPHSSNARRYSSKQLQTLPRRNFTRRNNTITAPCSLRNAFTVPIIAAPEPHFTTPLQQNTPLTIPLHDCTWICRNVTYNAPPNNTITQLRTAALSNSTARQCSTYAKLNIRNLTNAPPCIALPLLCPAMVCLHSTSLYLSQKLPSYATQRHG